MNAARSVYVQALGAWWRLTPEQWLAVVEHGAKYDGAFTLLEGCKLHRAPRIGARYYPLGAWTTDFMFKRELEEPGFGLSVWHGKKAFR